jgi:hypothetical protein
VSVGRNKSTLNFEDEVVPVSQNRIENAIIKLKGAIARRALM